MCLYPQRAEKQDIGRPRFHPEGDLFLPCGKCAECLSKRALEWAIRAKHEIAIHNENSFITLTYNPDSLPSHQVLKDPFQKFMKRLRKSLKRDIRYMVSHEYGSKFFRPHHHAIIFGWNPKEQYEPRRTKSGETIFRSHELEKLWTNGFSSVGTANEKTAYYIASYATKGKRHTITLPNGELITVSDSMDVSKRPSIGYTYLMDNANQLINSKTPLPRYYTKKLEEHHPDLYEQYENNKLLNLKTRSSQQLLAKYEITFQKSNEFSSEFRAPELTLQEHEQFKAHLTYNRDNYHKEKNHAN